MANIRSLTAALGLLASCTFPVAAQNREPAPIQIIEPILDRFVSDYERDPLAQDITFGIEIEGLRWRVTSELDGEERSVTLQRGFGDAPLMYFTATMETLNLLDRGVWNGLTAMGAATSADLTPLDILTTPDYQKPADYDAQIRPLIFHFWTRGLPEVVPFGVERSRVVHGAPASALYYDEDFRSAVYHVPAGLGREQAPTLSVPFKRMVIVIAGAAEGEIGDEPFTAQAGDMILAPPNIPVTFWNASSDETLSFVWLMWGKGA